MTLIVPTRRASSVTGQNVCGKRMGRRPISMRSVERSWIREDEDGPPSECAACVALG